MGKRPITLLQFLCVICCAISQTACFSSTWLKTRDLNDVKYHPVSEWEEVRQAGDDLYLEFRADLHGESEIYHTTITSLPGRVSVPTIEPVIGSLPEDLRARSASLPYLGPRRNYFSDYPAAHGQAFLLYGSPTDPQLQIVAERKGQCYATVFGRIPVPEGAWYDIKTYSVLPLAIIADAVTIPIQLLGALFLLDKDLKVTGI